MTDESYQAEITAINKWFRAFEQAWLRKIVRPRAMKRIKADHSFYARDYNRFMFERSPESDRQYPDESWSHVNTAR